jgi:hypothetical protein
MNWNYRVTKRIWNHKYLTEPEVLYEIREVYYDEKGNIERIEKEPTIVERSVNELKSTLQKMIECTEKPTIDYSTEIEL